MTVQELRTVLLPYNKNMEVSVSINRVTTGIKYIEPCVDMDTNKVNCLICGIETRPLKYEELSDREKQKLDKAIDDFING